MMRQGMTLEDDYPTLARIYHWLGRHQQELWILTPAAFVHNTIFPDAVIRATYTNAMGQLESPPNYQGHA